MNDLKNALKKLMDRKGISQKKQEEILNQKDKTIKQLIDEIYKKL